MRIIAPAARSIERVLLFRAETEFSHAAFRDGLCRYGGGRLRRHPYRRPSARLPQSGGGRANRMPLLLAHLHPEGRARRRQPHPDPVLRASLSTPRHFYLVDGSGYIFRAFHALPPLTRQDGTPIGAVLGFSNMIYRLLKDTNADHIAIVFDAAETTFRNRIYDRYKANRSETPPELVPQFQLVRAATDAFGLARIERADFEADDLIATYARVASEAGDDVTIVSSDKDLMQLVSQRVRMFDPIKNKPIGAAEVREKFGVGPEQVIDVQALCGDSVDNVPGVPGIGVKTAAELITTYGTLEALLERAPEIKQPKRRQSLIDFADQARLSKQLVRLDTNVPLSLTLDQLAIGTPDQAKLIDFLEANGFRALVARVRNEAGGSRPGDSMIAAPAAPAAANLAEVETKYELVQEVAALDRWIADATERGIVALGRVG